VRNQTVRLAGANWVCPLAAPDASKGTPTSSPLARQISCDGLGLLLGIIFFVFLCPKALHGQGSDGVIEGNQIASTLTSSRQIQLALKLIF
jgi:hypothetical protein